MKRYINPDKPELNIQSSISDVQLSSFSRAEALNYMAFSRMLCSAGIYPCQFVCEFRKFDAGCLNVGIDHSLLVIRPFFGFWSASGAKILRKHDTISTN